MAGTNWNDEEVLLEKFLRIYARKHQDRFAHLLSPTALRFKHAADGTKIGDTTVSAGFACLDYSRASVAPLSSCFKTCPFCVKQFRPLSWQETIPVLIYQAQHSDAEAAEIIRALVQQTRESLAHIRGMIRTSGNMLAKRWQKRNPNKRVLLLQAAMPHMRRRMGMLMLSDTTGIDLSTLKPQLSLPYLSVDTMSEDPMRLLALLHHRSSARMSDWVVFDGMQVKSSFSQGVLEASYNPHCVTMYGEDDDVGNLVFWNKDEAHRSQIIGYPLAKIILEAQCIMSSFLVSMVNSILQSPVELASQGHDLWDSLRVADFVKTSSDNTAPVSRRPGFRTIRSNDLDQLRRTLSNIKARHSANKSETWLLQTDPPYARQTLASLERYGQGYSNDEKRDTMTPLLLSYISREIGWHVLEETAKIVLRDLEMENFSSMPDSELRMRCAVGLQVLERALEVEFKSILVRTRIRSEQIGYSGHPFGPRTKHHSFQDKRPRVGYNMCLWALDHMGVHDSPDVPIPEHYLALIEHDLASQRRDEGSNETLYDYVSDLSALDEAIMAIKCIRPGQVLVEQAEKAAYFAEIPHKNDLKYADYVDLNVSRRRDILWKILKSFLSVAIPANKANRASLAAFDASHAALGEFWEVARASRRKLLVESGCPHDRVEVLMVAISAGLSPEYTVKRQNERSMLVNEILRIEEAANKRSLHQRGVFPSNLPLHTCNNRELAHDTTPLRARLKSVSSPGVLPQSHGKNKIKTRPSIAAQGSMALTDTVNTVPQDAVNFTPSDRISVCSTSMDVFKRMFVSYGKHTNSNLRWGEFVKAMNDAGFAATWSTGGSAVVFDDSRGNGAIRLHQPHPDPSINPIMLRSFGKRMFKQFGWSIETFVEGV